MTSSSFHFAHYLSSSSCSHTHTHTKSFSLTHTYTVSLSHTHTLSLYHTHIHCLSNTHTLSLFLLYTHTHSPSLTHTVFFLSPFCFDTISYPPLSCVPLIFSWLSHFFGFRRVTIFYFYCRRSNVSTSQRYSLWRCSFLSFSNDRLLSLSVPVLRDDFNSCCHIHFYDAAVNEI